MGETSVFWPRSRESLYSFILRCGLWLARAHPEVREPADWSIEICASIIGAVGRMNVDDHELGTKRGTRKLLRFGEPMMPHSRANFIYSLRRFMIDYESWGWDTCVSALPVIFQHPIRLFFAVGSIPGLSMLRCG